MTHVVLTEVIGKVGLIRINRPEAMNALNNEVVDGIVGPGKTRGSAGVRAFADRLGIPADAGVDVGVVDGRGGDSDQHLARFRLRHRHVGAVIQRLIAAVAGKKNGVHGLRHSSLLKEKGPPRKAASRRDQCSVFNSSTAGISRSRRAM